MISRAELNELSQEWSLAEQVVEKDYVIGWVLWGIGNHLHLRSTWAFKGGTCLKKCYIETYRFSEDLDFTVMEGGALKPEEVAPIFEQILDQVGQESGIDFSQPPRFKQRGSWPSVEGRIYYRGPRQTPTVASLKIDLLASEVVVRPTVLRSIAHPYSDETPAQHQVRCYSFEELFAEKIRALGERCRSRDLYDVINLYRRRDLHTYPDVIRQVLIEKCVTKNVMVPTFDLIQNSPFRAELESEWRNMLEHQLPALPPFEHYWSVLSDAFAWLEGKQTFTPLEQIAISAEDDTSWQPPPTIWSWGMGIPLETIRFAGANHLCVELGYQGSTSIIEPYSLRRSLEGNLLLYAIRTDSGECRSYRVDRIESIKVTTIPFQPVHIIEFAQSGPIDAPPLQRSTIMKSLPRLKTLRGVKARTL